MQNIRRSQATLATLLATVAVMAVGSVQLEERRIYLRSESRRVGHTLRRCLRLQSLDVGLCSVQDGFWSLHWVRGLATTYAPHCIAPPSIHRFQSRVLQKAINLPNACALIAGITIRYMGSCMPSPLTSLVSEVLSEASMLARPGLRSGRC